MTYEEALEIVTEIADADRTCEELRAEKERQFALANAAHEAWQRAMGALSKAVHKNNGAENLQAAYRIVALEHARAAKARDSG